MHFTENSFIHSFELQCTAVLVEHGRTFLRSNSFIHSLAVHCSANGAQAHFTENLFIHSFELQLTVVLVEHGRTLLRSNSFKLQSAAVEPRWTSTKTRSVFIKRHHLSRIEVSVDILRFLWLRRVLF